MPICPFCGIRLSWLDAFVCKNRSFYTCLNCGKRSEVELKDEIYKILLLTQILAIAIFVTAMFLGDGTPIFGMILVGLIFLAFYIVSPYMLFLKKSTDIEKSSELRRKRILNIAKIKNKIKKRNSKQDEEKEKMEKEKMEKEKSKEDRGNETNIQKTNMEFEDIFSSDENKKN